MRVIYFGRFYWVLCEFTLDFIWRWDFWLLNLKRTWIQLSNGCDVSTVRLFFHTFTIDRQTHDEAVWVCAMYSNADWTATSLCQMIELNNLQLNSFVYMNCNKLSSHFMNEIFISTISRRINWIYLFKLRTSNRWKGKGYFSHVTNVNLHPKTRLLFSLFTCCRL